MVNNLIKEGSPYLLEHANNPVDWYAWGKDAFQLAIEKNIPIFVSIGYSACHWCHVMRRESFENEETATLMNKFFVNIKLDREERPDIDHQLQLVHQMLNGRAGGWPLSIWLTPDKKPFYSGTYFPSEPIHGMPSFNTVISAIQDAFTNKREQLYKQAGSLEAHIQKINKNSFEFNEIEDIDSEKLIKNLLSDYDTIHGGFGSQPKFPNETTLFLLLHESARLKHSLGIESINYTLTSMIEGGIYDQLGGGFHRYTIDAKWLVPHFEKMLYNQGLMIKVLVEAYRVTKNILFKDTIREIIDYLKREMLDDSNAFYSSQNADSEGVEGKFFVWDYEDIKKIISDKQEFNIISKYYDISKKGNWESNNILHVHEKISILSKKFNLKDSEIKKIIEKTKEKLLIVRNNRIKPSKDTKIITSWNSLVIQSIIQASSIFVGEKEKEYLAISKSALDFFISKMIEKNDLFRIYINRKNKVKGFLDDYQYFIAALLEFYRSSLDKTYLDTAKKLFDKSVDLFINIDTGEVYYSTDDHSTIGSKFGDILDSPLPSPIGITLQNSQLLAYYYEKDTKYYRSISKNIISNFQNLYSKVQQISISTFVYSHLLFQNYFTELVVIEDKQQQTLFHMQINETFTPFRLQFSLKDQIKLEISWLKDKINAKQKNCVYICRKFVCSLPLTTIADFKTYINKK